MPVHKFLFIVQMGKGIKRCYQGNEALEEDHKFSKNDNNANSTLPASQTFYANGLYKLF